MHLKRFEGTSMADVLRQVREELGPDALVVSQRTVRRERGIFGRLARPVVEVTAAAERSLQHEEALQRGSRVAPDESWKDLRLARALVGPMEAELQSLRGAIERLSHQTRAPSAGLLADEIQELRRIALSLRPGTANAAEDAGDAARTLCSAGLDAVHADAVAAAAARRAGGEGAQQADALVDALAMRLDDKLRPPRSEDAPALLCVGPPGAGKTTTLAKLAARSSVEDRHPVVLTTDVHRVGADASLRACARELDVPFEAAVSPESLARSVGRFSRQPVLVDTSGRSRRDLDALPDLLRLRDALGKRARVCLVLPATHKEIDLRADLKRYRELEPDEMVFTKLDESCDFGNVGNVLLDEACPPLTWIATGQRVPQDLHVADPSDLARRILGVGA